MSITAKILNLKNVNKLKEVQIKIHESKIHISYVPYLV